MQDIVCTMYIQCLAFLTLVRSLHSAYPPPRPIAARYPRPRCVAHALAAWLPTPDSRHIPTSESTHPPAPPTLTARDIPFYAIL